MKLFVSGGSGFVGSSLTRQAISFGVNVFNIDIANKSQGLPQLENCHISSEYSQLIGNVTDSVMLSALIREFNPHAFIHCAGGTSWKKGIQTADGATATIGVLDAVKVYYSGLSEDAQKTFKFIVPFDTSVFGSLTGLASEFSGMSPLAPQSIDGGKACIDLNLIQGWMAETGIPVIFVGASALYGKWQPDEAFLPQLITSAFKNEEFEISRANDTLDWLHVDDFAQGLICAAIKGEPNATYLLSARSERRKIDIANNVMTILDGLAPRKDLLGYGELIKEHSPSNTPEILCALNTIEAETKLGWYPKHNLLLGMREIVAWHLEQSHPKRILQNNKAANEDIPQRGLAAE